MSTKAERGTKRTCQNPECGSRFYDLNRDPVICPICQTVYQLEAAPLARGVCRCRGKGRAQGRRRSRCMRPNPSSPRTRRRPRPTIRSPPSRATRSRRPAEEDETFLEDEEEDGTDMSNIIGGPVAEKDEQQ